MGYLFISTANVNSSREYLFHEVGEKKRYKTRILIARDSRIQTHKVP
jgi:hypothetical protein